MLKACPTCGRIQCEIHAKQERTGAWAAGSTRAWRKTRARILARDGYTCRVQLLCHGDRATHVDHIVPRSAGGNDDDTNLRAACKTCNLARGAARVHA